MNSATKRKEDRKPEPRPKARAVSVQVCTLEALIAFCRMKPALLRALAPELQARIEARLKWAA